MADIRPSQEERIERLKALLTGRGQSGRTKAALASGGLGNLFFGVALHGADARGSRALTSLEQVLVDALGTVVEDKELREWGTAYRETVRSAAPGTLTVPAVIAERPVSSGYAIADLEQVLPQLAREAFEAPNVSLLTVEDIAAGRTEEDPGLVEAMRERGFAVTGVARHPSLGTGTRAGAADTGPDAGASWRVKMEMDNFYVVRAVGDQGGGKDEIYFASAAGVGDGRGQTFVSEEFGAVKQGQTRTFSTGKKVFLDQQSSNELMVAGIQVWEADQSSSEWYTALQQALNRAVEQIDLVLSTPVGAILDPIPLPVAIAYEIAKVFIALMDTLRNHDDLSCSRTFVLTRDDMAILHHQPSLEWNFNGDGHHKLRVRYTGERPVYPVGSIEITSRAQGPAPSDAGEWSAPIPLGWKTTTTPALASYRGDLYTVFSRTGDNKIVWSRYDGAAWTTPRTIAVTVSDQPSALAVHQDRLHWLHTGRDGRIYHAWFDGREWSLLYSISGWTSALGPSLAAFDGRLWSAHTGDNNRVYVADYVSGTTWNTTQRVGGSTDFTAHSAPALGFTHGKVSVDHRRNNDSIFSWYSGTGPASGWSGEELPRWRTRHAPTVHHAGRYEWMAHAGTNGHPYLAWRDTGSTGSWRWTDPAVQITRGPWACTSLAAPSLTTHNGRMYAIYHA
ncbi:hypothetical protein AF335_08910 [Streptomyces eurocidicus]|uniref:Uncharacterized protein n=1 Tax=Streptomyces eurocidicus TaxID=66423 RepID=A0A2N8P0W0_STREU|nr:hypothetical protein [Streptomyces eurocidicus]MBB5122933.1 hypothetical protein [Streptomyces eurocidicus]MBF6055025.1 hypothetical protein [Streptomyces eurocidicus]PNE34644.1 hypothetical protein AF335_08910 [Streptomyces eurocidicus]